MRDAGPGVIGRLPWADRPYYSDERVCPRCGIKRRVNLHRLPGYLCRDCQDVLILLGPDGGVWS